MYYGVYVVAIPATVQHEMYCHLLQIVPVLYPREMEMEEPIVKDFMETDEFRYYVEDGEVMYCGPLQSLLMNVTLLCAARTRP